MLGWFAHKVGLQRAKADTTVPAPLVYFYSALDRMTYAVSRKNWGSVKLAKSTALCQASSAMWAPITVKQQILPTSNRIRCPHRMESPAHIDRNTHLPQDSVPDPPIERRESDVDGYRPPLSSFYRTLRTQSEPAFANSQLAKPRAIPAHT